MHRYRSATFHQQFVLFISIFLVLSAHVSADYVFDVFPVEQCPMCKEDWEMASRRLNCKSTHGYHCVPNKQFTSLIEFCYPKGPRFPFEKGNCLELAANGILNQVYCNETFEDGCPKDHYFSNEMYKFPKCLMISKSLRCFDADHACIYSGLLKNKLKEQGIDTTKSDVATTESNTLKDGGNQCNDIKRKDESKAVITSLSVITVTIVIGLIVVVVYKRRRKKCTLGRRRNKDTFRRQREKLEHVDVTEETYLSSVECTDEDQDSAFEDEPFISDNKESKIAEKGALQKLHDVIQGREFDEFKHLIQNFDRNALEQFNPRGFNSLHLAAKGGNFYIFEHILVTFKIDIETPAIDKRNVLHIAAFYGSCSICRYILENHKKLFEVKDRYNMNPAHWAALNGQESILKIMLELNCNLSETTPKYDENIVLFACIGESYEVCKFVGSTEGIMGILHWKNSEGWNSIQYAAKSGNLKVFKYLCEMGVDIENKSRQTGKNCLHTACERGNIEICTYILEEEKNETLITQVDRHEQHVGHFTAKSGNKNILDLLIKHLRNTSLPTLLEKSTTDKINILHIACRHARFDMCVKIADKFPSMISEITERGWNAALFITEKAGAEKERIMILKFLEKRKLNVYHVSRSGKTILYNACVNRSAILVKYLLNHYPDLLKIEKSMSARKAAKSPDIENIFKNYFSEKNENQTVIIK